MTEVPEAEREVGISVYATRGAPCPARAKASESDFKVEERLGLVGMTEEARPDYFPLYRVEKRGVDTMHMEREISEALRSRVSYGGLKDKRSVSVQFVTPTSRRSERPPRVEAERFTATLVGYVPKPISRGAVVGNRFEVTLRDCCAEVGTRIREALELAAEMRLPNFYGLQRFGSGAGTHRVGRELVRRRFREAAGLLLWAPGVGDDTEAREAKGAFENGKFEEGLALMPRGKDVEARVARALVRRPADWVGAMRAVPLKLRRLYVHAYQAYIFNRAISGAVRAGEDISVLKTGDNWGETKDGGWVVGRIRGVKDEHVAGGVPMVQLAGFAFRDYGSRFDKQTLEVLKEDGVGAKDFYVAEMQEVSAEGGFRLPHMLVGGPSFKVLDGTAVIRFDLPRGQYATVLLREVIKPRDPAGAGLG